MAANRRLLLLLCLLASLIGVQQLLEWWQLRSSELQNVRNRSHSDEVVQHANRAEREQVRRGELWIGELHDNTGPQANDDLGHHRDPRVPTDPKSIAARIDFEQESLSAILELHECHPGSSLCSSGGVISVVEGDRPICVIAVGLLQPQEKDGQKSYYRVSWKPREDGLAFTETQRLNLLKRLAGTSDIPNRVSFHRLLRVAYGYESQQGSPFASESIEKTTVRSVFGAIVHSRADLALTVEVR